MTEAVTQLYEWISACRRQLDKREAQLDCFYWRDDDDDEYCYDCFNKRFSYDDRQGGYLTEMDSCVHCAVCGKLLAYTLTDYGATEELNFFEEESWDWNNPEDCYHVARMLCAWTGSGYWTMEDLPDIDRVVKALRNGANCPITN